MTTKPPEGAARRCDDSAAPSATLEEVDIRPHLFSRPYRPPNHEAENRALVTLARELAENPRNMLQKLVETALVLCNADSAGISLLETQSGAPVFRWEALAGVFAAFRNNTMPRDASPCGVCIDRNATQLMHLPDRCFPALRADPRFVEALLIPFHIQGKPTGTVWIVSHDFDKKFDREDERIVSTLAQFASAGWQMWTAYSAAEEANRQKDQFLATLSHEFRNPLAAIRSAASLLKRLDRLPSEVESAPDVIERQVVHLARLLDDMLDVARVAAGKLELRKRRVDLRAVIRQALESSHSVIDEHGHRLTVSLPPEAVLLDADPIRLAQLFSNLIVNAARYTEDGGEIRLTLECDGPQAVITVADSGIGIAQELLTRIFEPYTQLDTPPGGSGRSGLGLGLFIVRSIAVLSGGGVEAFSDGPGKGSRFVVRLPLAADQHIDPPSSAGEAQAKPCRIMIVEDNRLVAQSLAAELRRVGHHVSIAHDGPSALALRPVEKPDVVLLDIGLPGLNGYEIARRLRAEPEAGGLLLIALSGYADEESRRKSKEAGFDYHLTKPADAGELRAIFQAAEKTAA